MRDDSKLKFFVFSAAFICAAIAIFCCGKSTKYASPIQEKELRQYSRQYGYQLWEELKKFPIAFSLEDIIVGMRASEESKMLPEEETEPDLLKKLTTIRKESLEKRATKNIMRAEEFLNNISQRRDVHAIEEHRLYYKIKAYGTGSWCVEPASNCYFHYTITTIDNEKIVDTRAENKPKQVDLTTAFPCFTKGVVGMKKGERRVLYAHPDLAYGRARQIVPPGTLVIIDVEALGEAQSET